MPNLSYLSPKVAVQPSAIQGRGLFAIAPISAGELVCVKGGYIYRGETLRAMGPWYQAAEIPIGDDLFIGPVTEDEREGSMIYSNHSCDPNVGVQGQIVFVAMRDIEVGDELTHDWAMTDDDSYEMECNCGAVSCRRIITGQDWCKPELQEKYKGFMSSYLAAKIQT